MSKFMSACNLRELIKQKTCLNSVKLLFSPASGEVFKIVESLKRESKTFTNLQRSSLNSIFLN